MSDPATSGSDEESAGEVSPASSPVAGAVPAGRGLSQLNRSSFDVLEAVGGPRGLIESIAPGLVFVVVFVASRDLTWSLIGAVALALVGAISRLVARSSLNYVFSGLLGVGIGTIWAWRTGQAEDFFVWGLYVNAAGVVGALISILARRPLVGLVVGALVPALSAWHRDRQARRLLTWATWLWVALFGLRLAVQLPLYLNSQVGWLGTARLVMGVPLWAIVLYFTWLLVHPVIRRARESRSAESPSPEDDPERS
ncbi:MAG TPA: DUF3159 domain-containing protein [Beutenbergiaceae bacterium]|nr:DUF3159 domain-containing protein [Beutenbergiaceae bacterium]